MPCVFMLEIKRDGGRKSNVIASRRWLDMAVVLFWYTNVSPQKPASLSTGTVHMTVSLPSYFPLVATAGFEKHFQTILLPEPLAVGLTLGQGGA